MEFFIYLNFKLFIWLQKLISIQLNQLLLNFQIRNIKRLQTIWSNKMILWIVLHEVFYNYFLNKWIVLHEGFYNYFLNLDILTFMTLLIIFCVYFIVFYFSFSHLYVYATLFFHESNKKVTLTQTKYLFKLG